MTSALIGLLLILLIAAVTVALGALTRLLAARVVAPRELRDAPLTPRERIALGNEAIARDLQPDDIHPVARTASSEAGAARAAHPVQHQDLALRHPEVAAYILR